MSQSIVKRVLKSNNVTSKVTSITTTNGVFINIISNPFLWNGECLGVLTDINLIKIKEPNCFKLNIYNYIGYGSIRRIINTHACIIDELKTVFGLPKLGTHWFIYENKIYLLTKLITKKIIKLDGDVRPIDEIVYEKPLKDVKIFNPIFTQQVKATYVFRDLLGIRKSLDCNIIVREDKNFPYPISCGEKRISIKEGENIPHSEYDSWFSESCYSNALKQLLQVYDSKEAVVKYEYLKEKMQEVISRIDSKYNYLAVVILRRITNRLVTYCNFEETVLQPPPFYCINLQ